MSETLKAVSACFRLCRLMCGKSMTFRYRSTLFFGEAAPRRTPKARRSLKEADQLNGKAEPFRTAERQSRHASFYGLTLRCASLLAVALCAACSSSSQNFDDGGRGRRYDLHGKIVSVNKPLRQVTVAHDPIPGYMDAMTMPYKVREAEALNDMRAGDDLRATLVVDGERSWLENPSITQGGGSGDADANAYAQPAFGTPVPDFALENQDGKTIRLAQYRGRALAVTFIYTRCPLPDYCPLMTRNFSSIANEIERDSQLKTRVHLLSVTIDPDFDTSAVLRDYAQTRAGLKTFELWDFATGTGEQIKQIAQFFGLNYYKENNQIIHALRTAVITPDGKIYKVYGDNTWTPEDVLRDLRAAVEQDVKK